MPSPEHPPSPDYMPALSPGYIADSDLEEDPEEDPEEDHADYPVDGGDDDDDDSSDDNDDDEEEQEDSEDDDEEEEHSALTDSSVVPVDGPVPSAQDTEAYETDESALTAIPSPRRYKAAGIRLRATLPSTHHPSEIPSPPLLLPSNTHRDDLPEVDMPLRKRTRFTAPTGRFEVGESSSAAATRQAGHTLAHIVEYGFVDNIDASIRAFESRAMAAVGVVNERVTDLATTQRQDAQELYVRCEDIQDDRALLRAQVSLLTRERRYFSSMASSYEHEAVIARQAWSHSKSRIQAMEA
ncbi:hypothetical protein Tco_1512075 [Tanacetum coccineum]